MKHTILYYIATTLAALLLAACTTRTSEPISVSPHPYEVVPTEEGTGSIDLSIDIPAGYMSKRSRLFITPMVVADDSTVVAELKPVILDGGIFSRKMDRRIFLEGYIDPYALTAKHVDTHLPQHIAYKEHFNLPEGFQGGYIEGVVSNDGCGSCSVSDSFPMATLAAVPKKVVEVVVPVDTTPIIVETKPEPLGLAWMEPAFVVHEKVMQGQGTAHLQFIINKYDIVPSLGNNRAELEQMVAKLEPILSDTLAEITSITIYGMASADGPLSLNTPLSANRAKSAKQWLAQRLNLPTSLVQKIKTGSRPEGWQPVLDAMTAAGNPDSVKVKEILRRYAGQNDDVAERYIRRLSCWPTIRENYLQKDRKVDYTYAWRIRSFSTDAELVQMYQTRPDAFNEAELLRVAQLAADEESQMLVYRYTLSRFPTSEVAANNLAILLERRGEYEEARRIYEAAKVLRSINK